VFWLWGTEEVADRLQLAVRMVKSIRLILVLPIGKAACVEKFMFHRGETCIHHQNERCVTERVTAGTDICMYICVCVCIYVCMYYVCVCMYVRMYVCVCMYVCMNVCMYVCVCIYVCVYICMNE
jgi:hypothetical protein